jgi:hypothetical protein
VIVRAFAIEFYRMRMSSKEKKKKKKKKKVIPLTESYLTL